MATAARPPSPSPPRAGAPPLPAGLVAFVKRECPTCARVAPVPREIAARSALTVYSQDDPAFPEGLAAVDDRELAVSWHHRIEAVPTLLRVEEGAEAARAVGWHRGDWEELTGLRGLGPGLPELRPGCGSRSEDPDLAPKLAARYGAAKLHARRVELAALEDEIEALHARGWTDGLPAVPPTEERVLAMLEGTTRDPAELVAVVPPDLVPCTVEKVAINAVLAGCRPEQLPVVLAAVEAACTDEFNMHGVLATTMPVGPVIVVNGPIRRALGMGSGRNVFGQGNRANLAIGRALQLVVRNVGGGRPGEVDRATHGNPASSPSASPRTRRARPGSRSRARSARRRVRAPSPSSPARGRAASSTSSRAIPSRSRAASPPACARSTTRSSCSPSTACSRSAPSTRASSARRAGAARGCSAASTSCCGSRAT